MKFITAILVALPLFTQGQGNFVPNGDFEYFSSCIPNSVFYISIASPWQTPTTGSPDYFNACCPPTTGGDPHFGVPENLIGTQLAHSGNGYAGFFAYSASQINMREYLQVELTGSLVYGLRYEVCFHVSLVEKVRYTVNTLGAYLSDSAISRNDILRFEEIPQILNAPENSLASKTEWVAVCDTFVSRTGNERFITIGNFHDDAESGVLFVDSLTESLQYKSYYYIDDVSVIALDSIPNGVEEDGGLAFKVYPNPAQNHITITAPSLLTAASVSIYSISGQRLVSDAYAPQIDISTLPNGVYFIELRNQTSIGRRRFVKM